LTIRFAIFSSSPTLQATLSGHESIVYEARWHPRRSGLIASVSADCSLRLFDIKQSSNIVNRLAHPAEILSLDWSKYDDHLLVTGACDNRLRLWDIRMITNALMIFEGHEAAVRRVKFDPYRRDRLASTGYDGQLKLWNLTSTNSNINIHTERICKEFIYGLDWNLFERDKLAVGAWDKIVRLCEIVSV
jgi:peroxin-7